MSRITVPLTLILRITDDGAIGTETTKNGKNQDIQRGVGGGGIYRDIKNLSSIVKSVKSKKPNFAKSNFFGMEFLTSGPKEAFIHI